VTATATLKIGDHILLALSGKYVAHQVCEVWDNGHTLTECGLLRAQALCEPARADIPLCGHCHKHKN